MQLCGVNCGNSGHGMDALGQPIHCHKDGIVSFRLWQFSDGVNRDNLPAVGWDPVWGKLPHLLCWEGLAAVADITPCHIAGNIVGDAWPPVIVGDQLQCLPLPWVASHHRVMVGMDNVMVELGVFWDIHTSPVHDQVSISLPLIQLKCACSKLSEGFYYCVMVVHTLQMCSTSSLPLLSTRVASVLRTSNTLEGSRVTLA